ncbi:MAG: type II secretion system F family protein [Planctomycetaceae bacterium]|nr:type II secretion system F family protein [Planctomycetaceae bacterium]
MPEFSYTARTLSGENVAGTISAGTKRETLALLAEKSLYPIHVENAEAGQFRLGFKKRVGASVQAATLTQLADLLQNGVPLLSSLEILAEQATHPTMGEVLADIRDQVSEGESLDVAFASHPDVFNELTVSVVRAGSEGAFLEDALKRTADFLELQEQLKNKVVGAMTYPAFLAVAGTIVVVILIVFFVPKFATLFERVEREGGGLPLPTILLLGTSHFLGSYGVFVGGGIAALGVWVWNLIKTPRGRMFVDKWKLRIPLFGQIFLSSALSRFCRILGTLLQNGVPILRALEISSESTGNKVLAEAITASAENISSGDTLSKPLAECGLIPRPIMAMISVAEESNNLDNVLVNVADTIDRKTAQQLDVMVRLIEPIMLLVMGSVILFVMVALLLPVFEMSTTMG